MVFVKGFSIALGLMCVFSISCIAQDTLETQHGYFIDRRGDVQSSYIRPPHPENIPVRSKVTQPVVDFESYYKVNTEGYRVPEDKLPLVPGYTENYSTRQNTLYSKEDYVNVWCNGEKHVGKIDCLNDSYAVSFFPVSKWTRGITVSAWRARGRSQQPVAALYAEDMGALTGDMYEAKLWATKWGVKIVFISIDAGIPEEWIR